MLTLDPNNPHQDPLRDQPVTDIEGFNGPVRVQDILAIAKAIECRQNGVESPREITVADFTKEEIGIAKRVTDELNKQVTLLGIKVVDNREGSRVPHAFVTMTGAMMHRFLFEGCAAANRGSWYKLGFYVSTIIMLIEAIWLVAR